MITTKMLGGKIGYYEGRVKKVDGPKKLIAHDINCV